MRRLLSLVVPAFAAVAIATPAAYAQGLVWKLPAEENVHVLYTGKFEQKGPPDSNGMSKVNSWTRHIDVKVLKKAKGMYQGKEVDCRWIEIVVRTGEFDALRPQPIDAGPAGQRMYRVLVPESAVVGKTKDARTIFVSMLPIAKDKAGKVQGVRKIGLGKSEWMKSPVLQVYPIVTMLHHYRDVPLAAGTKSIDVEKRSGNQAAYAKSTISADQTKTGKGSRVIEGNLRRMSNTATITFSDAVPTGLAGWVTKVVHEEIRVIEEMVDGQATKKKVRKYDLVAEVTCTMTVKRIQIGDAQSQLPDPAN